MYFVFAESLGVDISNEFISEKNYIEFARTFNHEHLKWLHDHDADARLSAFAAYEKLDNLDYSNLLELVKTIGVSKPGQIFFKVHSLVEHFSPTIERLEEIWQASPQKVIDAFEFIGNHQLKMWRALSDQIFN
jgi:hypothetical protein